jgi:hypothetical protein
MNNIVMKKKKEIKKLKYLEKKDKKKTCVQNTWYTENLEEIKYKYCA